MFISGRTRIWSWKLKYNYIFVSEKVEMDEKEVMKSHDDDHEHKKCEYLNISKTFVGKCL